MQRFHRKTAPRVFHGRVQRRNNWKQSPSCYSIPQRLPAIDRQRPGDGFKHFLMKRDIERFVNLIPQWNELSTGLDVILLARGRPNCDGWYNRGVLAICAWPVEMEYPVNWTWYRGHRRFLDRIEARVELDDDGDPVVYWTPWTVRAYLLCHVFLHELGHHRDRMTTRSRRECSRGEPYAESYAWEAEPQLWERYLDEFGLPE